MGPGLIRFAVSTAAAVACVFGLAGGASAQTAGSSYADVVVGDGPVSFWRVGEASGAVALDAVGANRGGYFGGFALGQPGAVAGDTAVSLNGTSGYVGVPDSASLHTGDNFSVELWVKPARLGGSAPAWERSAAHSTSSRSTRARSPPPKSPTTTTPAPPHPARCTWIRALSGASARTPAPEPASRPAPPSAPSRRRAH